MSCDKDQLEEVIEAAEQVSKTIGPWCDCPKCGAPPIDQELRNYDAIWGDGDIYCTKCGAYVRSWDRD